jgi:radical SAM superfamily enzyme YgiQ (UPF0313 family)
LHYEGNIIRPPSEANSILLQITVGCSRNKCTFCGAYKGERFRIKPDSIEQMIQMGKKAKAAGIKLSITVLLGIAGKTRSKIHARETGRVLSAMDPEYIGALSLMLIPGTPLYQDYVSGEFTLLKPDEMLQELKNMIAATELFRGLFHANHASNYLPIKARLPKDKAMTLRLIDEALSGNIALKPEYLRAF